MSQMPSEQQGRRAGADASVQKAAAPAGGRHEAAVAAEDPEEPGRLAASRILVIDDNAQNLEVLVAYLEGLGSRICTARSGAEALDRIRAEPPDLVLLDVMMPGMSGFEVCTKLKSDPATRDIPVLMVTALTEMDDIERGVQSGTDDFISKPVNRLELLTRVRSLLRVRHLKDELERTLAYLSDVEARAVPGRN